VSLVLLLHVPDDQVPRVVLVVVHLEPGDPGDDVVVDSKDHLTVKVNKRNLENQKKLRQITGKRVLKKGRSVP
jgi:hypothetical protein